MQQYFKLTFIIPLLAAFIQAEEIFVNTDPLQLAHITLSEKYCKNIKDKQQLCKSKKLSYIDYNDPQLPPFLKKIKEHIAPIVKRYKEDDLKSTTLSDIKEFNGGVSGNWYYESNIDLFSKTPKTYTLSTTSEGYTGGAHGYHTLRLDNYDSQTHKKLALSDLFLSDSNKTLHRIALAQYKRVRGLGKNQGLTKDGWFENRFVLAENFAITSNGLYFFYNSYEIKPYAAGNTDFMLPYSEIKRIIDPKGALRFALKRSQGFHVSFMQEEQISITVDAQINPDHTVTITAKMQNLSYLNKGWLSLYFPQLLNRSNIVKMQNRGFKQLHAYPRGSKIYHNERKKAIRSSYLLVEGEDKKWNYHDTHTISFAIRPKSSKKALVIDIRGNFISQHKSIFLPDEYEGTKGQQGFTNYRVFIGLDQ